MKKIFLIISMIATAVSLSASHYPDSVQQASKEEPNIRYGWNFEFAGGVGLGSYTYQQIGAASTVPGQHVTNKLYFPNGNASFGLNYYFVSWMGLGTGLQYTSYINKADISKPWKLSAVDPFGDDYTLTGTPVDLSEKQTIHMLEVPIALKFRARPGVCGFTATAGMKLGFPVGNSYKLSNGSIDNSVYYPFYDLTLQDVPTVVEDLPINSASGSLESGRLRKLNYAAYAEIGMLVRLQQRVELAITAYANYYINDVMDQHSTIALGFADGRTAGEYPAPYTTAYDGVLRTNEVESLHPWNVGIKLGLQINANRTKAQRDYDREQKRLKKEEKERLKQEELERQRQEQLKKEQEQPKQDTVPVVVKPDPREEAIRRIRQIADSNDIDICEVFCQIHDTVYLYRDPEPTPVIQEDTVAQQLYELLKKAVIFFEWDKAVPILEPADILEQIVDVLTRHPDQKIHVNGHTCRLGDADYNKRLAMRRAKAVAAQLKQLGVNDDQMIIASLGEDIPYRYNGQHQYSKDRRVEIVPTYRTTEIVMPGSRLAQIARRHYGNPEFWVFIYEANRDQIIDPDNLTPGIEIEIPDLSERLRGMNETRMNEEAERIKATIKK